MNLARLALKNTKHLHIINLDSLKIHRVLTRNKRKLLPLFKVNTEQEID